MAEEVGFEPTRAGLLPLTVFRTGRISHSRTLPKSGRQSRIRTSDILLPGQARYLAALIAESGGEGRHRTDALPLAGRMLSRLSYFPEIWLRGPESDRSSGAYETPMAPFHYPALKVYP